MHRVALVGLTLVPLTLALSRPGATQTPVDRIDAARAQIRARNLDSAAALLQQAADSQSGAGATERAAAFLWIGIVRFYQGDDSGTTRSFRAALALDPTIDAGSRGGLDSMLGAAWRRERRAPRCRARQAPRRRRPRLGCMTARGAASTASGPRACSSCRRCASTTSVSSVHRAFMDAS